MHCGVHIFRSTMFIFRQLNYVSIFDRLIVQYFAVSYVLRVCVCRICKLVMAMDYQSLLISSNPCKESQNTSYF